MPHNRDSDRKTCQVRQLGTLKWRSRAQGGLRAHAVPPVHPPPPRNETAVTNRTRLDAPLGSLGPGFFSVGSAGRAGKERVLLAQRTVGASSCRVTGYRGRDAWSVPRTNGTHPRGYTGARLCLRAESGLLDLARPCLAMAMARGTTTPAETGASLYLSVCPSEGRRAGVEQLDRPAICTTQEFKRTIFRT